MKGTLLVLLIGVLIALTLAKKKSEDESGPDEPSGKSPASSAKGKEGDSGSIGDIAKNPMEPVGGLVSGVQKIPQKFMKLGTDMISSFGSPRSESNDDS